MSLPLPNSEFLPVELYRKIFLYAETSELVTLSRVSRTFQHEAEYLLYYHVNLHKVVDPERLMRWCLSIVGEPRRAHLVHTLRFPAYLSWELPHSPSGAASDSRPTIHEMITQAFNAIINLKEIFVMGSGTVTRDPGTPSIYPSTLRDCQFQLTAFAGQVPSFTAEHLWDFLSKHPGIVYWVPSQPLLNSIDSIPQEILPNLREVVLFRPQIIKSLHGRPLQSLVLVFIQPIHTRVSGLEVIEVLGSFRDTLRHLVYTPGELYGVWTSTNIVQSIAQQVPNLISFTLTNFGRGPTVDTEDQQNLVGAMASFQNLDTLVIDLYMKALHTPNSESPDSLNPLELCAFWSGSSAAQCRNIATMFMASCRSLHRMSFPFQDKSGEISHLCYVRSASNNKAARLEGFYQIDTSTWWMR